MVTRVGFVLAIALALPAIAAAQQGGISGAVRDVTGAVLPGVTVVAGSPALIERARTATTDGAGQYKIINLPPGMYSVTFTLPGFGTVKREGIALTAGFTALVNADLKVGAVEETVTVTPVVDVQNIRQQHVMTRDVLDTLPTGKVWNAYAALLPAASSTTGLTDIGGATGDQQQGWSLHGSRRADQRLQLNGMSASGFEINGASTPYTLPDGIVQEVQMETGAQALDTESGGVRLNAILKEGGNSFHGSVVGAFTNHSLQGNNLTDELKAQRLTVTDAVKVVYDLNPTLGGPVAKDTLWFFAAFRAWGNDSYVGGNYFNATPAPAWTYTPDKSRQAYLGYKQHDETLRLTWQATARNKVTAHFEDQRRTGDYWRINGLIAPEAGSVQPLNSPWMYQVTWTSPISSKLLLEAGVMRYAGEWETLPTEDVPSNQTIGITDLTTGYQYRSRASLTVPVIGYIKPVTHQHNYRAALNYVTGSHAVKVGMTMYHGRAWFSITGPDLRYGFLNGRPQSLSQVATPYTLITDFNANLGLYAQDQWTKARWTINGGLRFDYLNTSVAPQTAGPGRFVPTRNLNLPEIPNVPNWTDLSPRVGVAYDLFGKGKTAIKASLSRFLVTESNSIALGVDPLNAPSQIANRTWTDDGNFVPDCDLLNPLANGECGALNNQAFGTEAGAQRVAPNVTSGFGVRTYNWEGSVSMQHEILPRASVNLAYVRRWWGNLLAVQNQAVTPADFDPFCITAPVDSRLPSGGGYQVCGLYDVKPAKFGQVSNVTVQANSLGRAAEVFDGIDITVNARLRRGILLQGGTSIGRDTVDNCDVVAQVASPSNLTTSPATLQPVITTPPSQLFCRISPTFWSKAQTRLQGSYPLPWDMSVSGTYQNLPGAEITALWQAPNAVIAPSLGRDLAAGASGVSVINLMEPGKTFGPRLNQLDVRLAKNLRFGALRVQGTIDVYNALNSSPILTYNTNYGPNWLVPTSTLLARFVKFGARLDF